MNRLRTFTQGHPGLSFLIGALFCAWICCGAALLIEQTRPDNEVYFRGEEQQELVYRGVTYSAMDPEHSETINNRWVFPEDFHIFLGKVYQSQTSFRPSGLLYRMKGDKQLLFIYAEQTGRYYARGNFQGHPLLEVENIEDITISIGNSDEPPFKIITDQAVIRQYLEFMLSAESGKGVLDDSLVPSTYKIQLHFRDLPIAYFSGYLDRFGYTFTPDIQFENERIFHLPDELGRLFFDEGA